MNMEKTKMAELVFIPPPLTGHFATTVEMAKLLVDRNHRLSITILIMRLPFDSKINSFTISEPRLKFVNLPQDDSTAELMSNGADLFSKFVNWNKSHVRNAVLEMIDGFSESTRLVGFVIDMFCTSMIDVANEFEVPTYVYFTCSGAVLGLMLHLQTLKDDHNQDVKEIGSRITCGRWRSGRQQWTAEGVAGVVRRLGDAAAGNGAGGRQQRTAEGPWARGEDDEELVGNERCRRSVASHAVLNILEKEYSRISNILTQDITEFKNSDAELAVPTFVNPIPAKLLPFVVLDKQVGSAVFLSIAKRFRETKGIMVDTFQELEFHAVKSFSDDDKIPPIYPVGPVLNLEVESNNSRNHQSELIMRWLDNQPLSSVVFLCFGSMGNFDEEQVKEITVALERSGHRFLWSLRRPPPNGKIEFGGEYENLKEVLPEGFLERTAEIGKVIGWAPQVAVLSHPAVGGFVSHCGWNSTLESLWCGVPVATWPMYAEQQANAFQLVKEFGMAVEIKMDYHMDLSMESKIIVTAAEIEDGIRRLMGGDTSTEIKKKVKEMSEKSRITVVEGGSSYNSLGRFIDDVMNNSP
ncbi:hydroquinone glucosyltransferase [Sarracenia purpurea var. burkii]